PRSPSQAGPPGGRAAPAERRVGSLASLRSFSPAALEHARFVLLDAAACLFAQILPDFGDIAVEGRAADDFGVARTRQFDGHHALELPRPIGHDQHAVGKLYGLGE